MGFLKKKKLNEEVGIIKGLVVPGPMPWWNEYTYEKKVAEIYEVLDHDVLIHSYFEDFNAFMDETEFYWRIKKEDFKEIQKFLQEINQLPWNYFLKLFIEKMEDMAKRYNLKKVN